MGDLTPDTTFTSRSPNSINSMADLQTWKDNSTLRDPPWTEIYPEHPDYGAVGNNSTVNTTAIQAALDDADAETYGAIVRLGPGIFVTDELTIPSNTMLVGAGRGLTTLKLIASAVDGHTVVRNELIVAGDSNIILRDLTIDGNKANQTGGHASHQGATFYKVAGLRVENCEFKNALHNGLVIQRGCSDYFVSNCYSHDNTSGGFYDQRFDSSGNVRGMYSDCIAINNGYSGFGGFDCDGTHYVNCYGEGNSQSVSGSADFAFDSSRELVLTNCISKDHPYDAFATWGNVIPGASDVCHDVLFSNCIAIGAGQSGFSIQNSKRVTINGGLVYNCGHTDTGYPGVDVKTALAAQLCTHIKITGLHVIECGSEGIEISGVTDFQVSGCLIQDNSAFQASQPGIRLAVGIGDATAIQSRFGTIQGCRIEDTQGTATQARAIIFLNATNNIDVLGNSFFGHVGDPLFLDAAYAGNNVRCSGNMGVQAVSQASAATLDPSPFSDFISVAGTTNISTAVATSHAYVGREISLKFADVLTLSNGITTKLAGAANFTSSADDVLTLVYDGTNWVEKCRSVN